MRIFHNGADGISASPRLKVARSTIVENGRTGIDAGVDTLIEENIINGNARDGIEVLWGLILGNTITGNARFGIRGGAGGYGNNYLAHTNGETGPQVTGSLIPLQPNACVPACP
jgi:hypothetical protein